MDAFWDQSKQDFYVAKRGDTIIGYMVCRVVADEDIKRFVIADFLFAPGCEGYLTVLLLRAFEEALRLGAHSISSWCLEGSTWDTQLKSFGFTPRSDIVLVWFWNEFAAGLGAGNRWHFTVSDSDNR